MNLVYLWTKKLGKYMRYTITAIHVETQVIATIYDYLYGNSANPCISEILIMISSQTCSIIYQSL